VRLGHNYVGVRGIILFSEFCVVRRVFSCTPHQPLCKRPCTHQAARLIRRSIRVLAFMRVSSMGMMNLVTHHKDRHLPWCLVYLHQCVPYSGNRTCSADKRSFLSKFYHSATIQIYTTSLNTRPGSSLPSGQSHESSFTNAQGISLDPSKHLHFPEARGTYFGIRSGRTPKALSRPATVSGRVSASIHGIIVYTSDRRQFQNSNIDVSRF
jgi:hypothetical protein